MFLKAVVVMLVSYSAVGQDGVPAKQDRGKQIGSFQLSLSSDKERYMPDEIIRVTAVLKNVTNDFALVEAPGSGMLYEIDVRVPFPEFIPFKPRAALTAVGAKQKSPPANGFSSGVGFSLMPGKEMTREFELNNLFEMRGAGDYHITFSCKAPFKHAIGPRVVITSNPIVVRVLAGKDDKK